MRWRHAEALRLTRGKGRAHKNSSTTRTTRTWDERVELEQLVSRGKSAARKLLHARILLLADASPSHPLSDEEIVAALGTSLRTVSRVRRQLVTEGLDVALLRQPQPLRPNKI